MIGSQGSLPLSKLANWWIKAEMQCCTALFLEKMTETVALVSVLSTGHTAK